ncbi:MAG: glycosyltransferase [Acidobacteriota bacterium]|nr:glycosyltransferase [Acidobacteriota bacterium]
MKRRKAGKKKNVFFHFGITLVSLLLVAVSAFALEITNFWAEFVSSSNFIRVLFYPFLICLGVVLCGLIFRSALWLFYHPEKWSGNNRNHLPMVSVILPAYNEEDSVARAVEAIMNSDYPESRLELICINDGSIDRTWEILIGLKKKYSYRLRLINLKKNRGKRKAIYKGLKLARGEIIITTDADSQVQRQAIRNLILPLLKDNRVGAVAGRVAVLNEKKNLPTRMLTARYALSFDFSRAYQSVYGGVLCSPGALSAFRRPVIKQVSGDWVRQKFLGVECNHGEDRSLTNLILKKGYLVKYQSNAVVRTRVPETIKQINRMYLRWTRSYVRESWFFIRFMVKPEKKKFSLLPAVDFFLELMLHPLHLLAISLLAYSFLRSPEFILKQVVFLICLNLAASLNNLKIQQGLKFLYGIPHGLFAFLFQWWIMPWALLTAKNQDWLTK